MGRWIILPKQCFSCLSFLHSLSCLCVGQILQSLWPIYDFVKIICKSFYQNIGEFSNSLFQEGPGCILRIILRIIVLLKTDLCESLYMSLNLYEFIWVFPTYSFGELQPWAKHLRKTLVFMWNSALQEKFNFCFQEVFW